MIMKKCEVCGAKISRKSKICPYCSEKPNKVSVTAIRTFFLWFILLIVVGSILFSSKSTGGDKIEFSPPEWYFWACYAIPAIVTMSKINSIKKGKSKNTGRVPRKWILLSVITWFILTGMFVFLDEKYFLSEKSDVFVILFVLLPIICALFVLIFPIFKNSSKGTYKKHFMESDKDIAARIIIETEQASISMIQRKAGWSYERSARAMDELEKLGIVSPFDGGTPRKILVLEKNQAEQTILTQTQKGQTISEIDGMEGHQFEYWCADLLRNIGFIKVEVTQGSGDQGVDILAEKDGIKYAIQCKCYSSDLGNKPVQEVNTGKTIYRCQIGAVITNRYFTQGGKEAAEATGVLLWDRDWIQEKLQES